MPKIGVGVIIVKDNQVLLGKRLSKHGFGTWSFTGGHLEEDETPAQCAIRETKEETGLVVSKIIEGPWVSDFFEESNQHYLTLFFISQHQGGTPQLTEPDKIQEWSWFNWNALPNPLFKPIKTLLAQGFDEHKLKQHFN